VHRFALGLAVLGMVAVGTGSGAAEAPTPPLVTAGCGTELPSAEAAQAAVAGLGLDLVRVAQTLVAAPPDASTLEAGAALPITQETLGACTGAIQPGVQVVIDNAFLCTLNWIFQDQLGAYYVGTAGHCVGGCGAALHPQLFRVDGVASDIGDAAYATGNCGVGNDFALIRIDPAYYGKIDPALCHFGGAQGVWTAGGNQVLMHYGWGTVWGAAEPTRHRMGVLDGSTWSAGSFEFLGMVGPGDSGSPIMVWDPASGNGYAVGVVTHTLALPLATGLVGPQFASRLDKHLDQANAATSLGLVLVTSPTQPNPAGDGL